MMLSEMSQSKTNTIWSHFYVDSKKKKKPKTELIDTKKILVIA